MKKINVVFSVDEEAILRESGLEKLDLAVSQELKWLHNSGMYVDAWSYLDPHKQKSDQLRGTFLNYVSNYFDEDDLHEILHKDLRMTHDEICLLGIHPSQGNERGDSFSNEQRANYEMSASVVDIGSGVKSWYLLSYPDDTLGFQIQDDVKFTDIVKSLNSNVNIDYVLGEGTDYIVRERVLAETARILNLDYDLVYFKWLKGDLIRDIPFDDGSKKVSFLDRIKSKFIR